MPSVSMRSAPKPERLGPVAHARVDERGELGRVDLDVLAAERDELLDLRAPDLGGVGEHRERVAVGGRRVLRAPEAVEDERAGHRDLERQPRAGPRVAVLLGHHRADLAQLRRHRRGRGPLEVALRRAPRHRAVVLDELDALDRLGDRPHEQEAAHLAVGDDVDARALLHRDDLIDGAVLDALEVVRRQLALLEGRAGLLQVGRAQHRSDHLGAVHGLSSGSGTTRKLWARAGAGRGARRGRTPLRTRAGAGRRPTRPRATRRRCASGSTGTPIGLAANSGAVRIHSFDCSQSPKLSACSSTPLPSGSTK